MTHPEELLAGFVDDDLSEPERAVVERHLAGCARCAGEARLAGLARDALATLPPVQAPVGIGRRAQEEAEGGAGVRHPIGAPVWHRWAGIGAVAAAVLLVVVLVLPKLGGGAPEAGTAAAPEQQADPESSAASPILELSDTDYDRDSVAALAAKGPSTRSAQAAPDVITPPARTAAPGRADHATACLRGAFVQVPGMILRLIQARFEGEPAFLGFYEEGPGAGQPADTFSIRVASVQGCRPLSLAQARL